MKQGDLQRLRRIILGPEQDRLANLERRADDRDVRTSEVSQVLSASLELSHQQDPDLARALQDPVQECITQSVREQPQEFADALFPVMGPAIRRAVSQMLRSFAQQINQAFEYGLTPKGLGLRLQAWRAGVPFGQYVLRHTLSFWVEEAYLIRRESGLLVENVQREVGEGKDDDAVSAMFTAIQDFIRDSFSSDPAAGLEIAELGELSLWGVHGPNCVLVCVIRGTAPRSLRAELQGILEQIEGRFSDDLKHFNGSAPISGEHLKSQLRQCLEFQGNEDLKASGSRWFSPASLLFAVLLLAVVAALVIQWINEQKRTSIVQVLEAEPGIVVTEVVRKSGLYHVRGLRDPLAREVSAVLEAAGLVDVGFDSHLVPFQSLESEMVLRRAHELLHPPPSVALSLDGDRLSAQGAVPAGWHARAESLASFVPGVSGIDLAPLVSRDDVLLERARAALEPEVATLLQVVSGELRISGHAPHLWIESLPDKVQSIEGIVGYQLTELERTEALRIRELVDNVDETVVTFAIGETSLDTEDRQQLDGVIEDLLELSELTGLLGEVLTLGIEGYSDSVGSAQLNAEIRQIRAQSVATYLVENSIDRQMMSAGPAPESSDASRKAVIKVMVASSNGN